MADNKPMCGIDQAIEWLQTKTLKSEDMPDRIIERLKYIRAKDEGIRPKFRKGMCGKKYDTWNCGNCGAQTRDGVGDNYCRNCGYKILWDNPRCLTGVNE